jgi:hypothetical protein
LEAGRKFAYGGSLGLGYTYDSNPNSLGGGAMAGADGAASEAESDLTTSGNFFLSLQMGSAQRMLLVDWRNSLTYHWQRSESPAEYNSRLNLAYTYRFFAPAMFSANVTLAYLNQPDYSQVNFREQGTGSSDDTYFTGDAKFDLAYRWHPQFTTRTSLALNSILYFDDPDGNSNWAVTVGNEARFHTDRFVWIGETRYQDTQYVEDSGKNSTILYLLLGLEWRLDPWLQTSLRLGEAIRSSEAGGDSASPYGEFALTYRPDLRNTFTLQTRYGYEETGFNQGGQESIAARVGLTYSRIFTSRTSVSLSGNYIRTTREGDAAGSTETVFDAGLSLNYRISKRITLTSQLSYTQSESSGGESAADFTRKRFTISANYEF